MAEIVLTTDQTLLSEFRNLPLGDFLSCVPVEGVPERIFNFIGPFVEAVEGEPKYAPYGLRKVEAVLKNFYGDRVALAHPLNLEQFIGPDTKIVGVYTMDPLGLGPVSLMFTAGGKMTAYTKDRFIKLITSINAIKQAKDLTFKLVVGGPGVWELEYRPQVIEELRIDHTVYGEVEHVIVELLDEINEGGKERNIRTKGFPSVEQILPITGPSMDGLVEVMRGCGRGCQFCEVTLRATRYMPFEMVGKEIEMNVAAGHPHVFAHSDDIFMYRCEKRSTMEPNADAIIELFRFIMGIKGVESSNATHGTLAGVLANPEMMDTLSQVLRAGPENWIGLQVGFETGSPELAKKIMPMKMKPFSPEEWREVIMGAMKIIAKNYWIPAFTLIVGLPQETTDDIYETIEVIEEIEKIPNCHFSLAPLAFVPIGVLRGKEMFDMEKVIDEARYELILKCWKHNIKEIDGMLWKLTRSQPVYMKSFLYLMGRMGSRFILRRLEDYGKLIGVQGKGRIAIKA